MVSKIKGESREDFLVRARCWQAEYRIRNRERIRESNKRYYAAHSEEKKRYAKQYRAECRKLVWDHYFNGEYKCQHCDIYFDVRILHMHHTNGDGGDLKKEWGCTGRGGSRYYQLLVKQGFPQMDVESVCPNCHALVHLDQNS